ncbi:DUF167 domain-containing protein [Candidatus Woesearchaeota archaeon]|nr:DUF167 domain-containing protein [Candidatus Woesearchaeota archaeon]
MLEFDEEKNTYKINIKEKAEDNKANKELIKFLSKKLKKSVKIVSGLKSRNKIIQIVNK